MKRKYGFVADAFAHQVRGGAELTTHALIEAAKNRNDVWMAPCTEITEQNLIDLYREDKIKNQKTHLIFGNFSTLDARMLPYIIQNFDYSVIEYDYKFCQYRSPEKHFASEDQECDCHESGLGKAVLMFYTAAKHVFFMSELQRQVYADRFSDWAMNNTSVLSSVFSQSEWRTLENAITLQKGVVRKDMWAYQRSTSWIKGSEDAEEWAYGQGCKYDPCGFTGLDTMEMYNFLSGVKGLVALPRGGDTCPRMVIEAKLLGCELHINENVQHANEGWFANGTYDSIKEYLQSRTEVFWNILEGE